MAGPNINLASGACHSTVNSCTTSSQGGAEDLVLPTAATTCTGTPVSSTSICIIGKSPCGTRERASTTVSSCRASIPSVSLCIDTRERLVRKHVRFSPELCHSNTNQVAAKKSRLWYTVRTAKQPKKCSINSLFLTYKAVLLFLILLQPQELKFIRQESRFALRALRTAKVEHFSVDESRVCGRGLEDSQSKLTYQEKRSKVKHALHTVLDRQPKRKIEGEHDDNYDLQKVYSISSRWAGQKAQLLAVQDAKDAECIHEELVSPESLKATKPGSYVVAGDSMSAGRRILYARSLSDRRLIVTSPRLLSQ